MATTIACDESGSEGENLTTAHHPVFVHASTSIGLEQARDFVAQLRTATRTQAPELKSTTALLPQNRPALLGALRTLEDAGNIHLVEKSYFVTAKMVSTLLAQDPALAFSGHGRAWADYLHTTAPASVGVRRWSALLAAFNTLIRAHRRQDRQRPTPALFIDALEAAWSHCDDEYARELLHEMWMERQAAVALAYAPSSTLREFDPMWPSIPAVARTWTLRLGHVPLELITDNYRELTSEDVQELCRAAREPVSILGRIHPGVDLRGLRFVDSKTDPRVQVADILGGVGQEVTRLAMNGVFDDDLQLAAHEMLDCNVMCASDSAIDTLVERRQFRYLLDWSSSMHPS